jgi:hypothetical protein
VTSRSGRLDPAQLDAGYLAKCEEPIKLAGEDALKWSNQNAYGTSFPEATKRVRAAGWYFSLDQASDMAVAHQLNPKSEYVDALVSNLNYEGGTNPVNVTYVTGLGLKRQREIVHRWANNNRQTLPMDGIPIGNIQRKPALDLTAGSRNMVTRGPEAPVYATALGMSASRSTGWGWLRFTRWSWWRRWSIRSSLSTSIEIAL